MRRTFTVLAAVVSFAVCGAATAGAAAAAPGSPGTPAEAALGAASGQSVLFYCHGASGQTHPGQHNGWNEDAPSNERRNVGGTCPV